MSESPGSGLPHRLAELARTLAGDRSVEGVLREATSAAVELIPGVDTAGILLIEPRGRFQSVAATSELPRRLDAVQLTLGEGPCFHAALADTVVRVDDFRDEPRWPRYAPAVVELGILSGLSFKLYTGDEVAGALSLFSSQPIAWDANAETIGAALAAHAAAALMAARQEQRMSAALLTRDQIAQAKGIIMERFGVDDVRAFQLLRQLSQDENVKLIDLAQRVIDTRR
jgi:GAF domain-containing protein